jgi:hypothetical protein
MWLRQRAQVQNQKYKSLQKSSYVSILRSIPVAREWRSKWMIVPNFGEEKKKLSIHQCRRLPNGYEAGARECFFHNFNT